MRHTCTLCTASKPRRLISISLVAFEKAVSATTVKSFPSGETYDTTDPAPSSSSLLPEKRQPISVNCVVCAMYHTASGTAYLRGHARRMLVIRMALLTTERLFWYCGAHTAEQTIVPIRDDFADPYYQSLLFSVARGLRSALCCTVLSWGRVTRGSGSSRCGAR